MICKFSFFGPRKDRNGAPEQPHLGVSQEMRRNREALGLSGDTARSLPRKVRTLRPYGRAMAGYERRISVYGERRETIDAHRIAGVLIRNAKAEQLRAQGLSPKPEPVYPAMGGANQHIVSRLASVGCTCPAPALTPGSP